MGILSLPEETALEYVLELYRVIYEIIDAKLVIEVVNIGIRSNIYED